MDFFTATRVLEYFSNSRFENFDIAPIGSPSLTLPTTQAPVAVEKQKPKFNIFNAGGLLGFAISLLIGGVAVYLSWTCNSALEYNIALKVVFAGLAFIFGLLYILLYIIMRHDTCKMIKKTSYY